MGNVFGKYQTEQKTIKVAALDDAEVTIRQLTVNESNEFYQRIVSGFAKDGSAEINYNAIGSVRIDKVAAAMTDPKMSVKELKALSAKAAEAINEISDAIDAFSSPEKKGN